MQTTPPPDIDYKQLYEQQLALNEEQALLLKAQQLELQYNALLA